MTKTPKYERGGRKENNAKYRSKILKLVPKRLGIPDDKIELKAGIYTLDYKDRLLIQFEATGSAQVEISSKVSGRIILSPSRKKFMAQTEDIVKRAEWRLTAEEKKK